MQLTMHARINRAIAAAADRLWKIPAPEVILNQTPSIAYGELATPLCLGLAKTLRKAPRAIAEDLTRTLTETGIPGVRRIEVAGPGYVNFHLERPRSLRDAVEEIRSGVFPGFPASDSKVIVEHTNINPNKAAHIGHLRNAAIGDTFVRLLRFSGRSVEVQNYIDNTGVQVADVVVGFLFIERLSIEQVRRLTEAADVKFDYYCWDLYAKTAAFYAGEDPEYTRRAEVLHEIEAGGNPTAEMADLVAMAIVHCHLRTMERIHVRYHLLPRESDILHLKFWERAFALLKERNAIFMESEGRNAGCWVMRIDTDSGAEDKVIVRSNGTVTYVGKDIAYQLWKLGLLDMDFNYSILERYADGEPVWVTSAVGGEAAHPEFGRGREVYNVIDVRQSYPQTVVREGVRALGHADAAERSIHFSYEMVALTPACARQLGIELSEEDRKRPYVEVSGRKGQGVKADDLIDVLEAKALEEVEKRNPDSTFEERAGIAHEIAVGALRHFLLRFTRNAVIAFDFDEALNFDGETGPYIQYAAVRAKNILKKAEAQMSEFSDAALVRMAESEAIEGFLTDDEVWELVYTAARMDEVAAQAVAALEPATLARHAFLLAQQFNLFYHRHRVLSEPNPERRMFYLLIVDFIGRSLNHILKLMGITAPSRM